MLLSLNSPFGFNKHFTLQEHFYLLRYTAMYSGESQLVLQKNMSPPFSGLNSKPSIKSACSWKQARVSFGIDDGDDILIRNVH
jgi:hypothetical protein